MLQSAAGEGRKDLILFVLPFLFASHAMQRNVCRRDSFITHRAFCDALTEESAKAIGGVNAMAAPVHHHHHPMLFSPPPAHLQKAAQMGATIGGAGYTQMAGPATSATAAFGLGLPGLQNAQHHHPQQQDGGGGVMAAGLARTASSHGRGGDEGGGGGSGDGMTRDFLGLRAFSHRDILGLAGLDSSCMGAITASASMGCYEPQQQHTQPQAPQQQQSSNEPWHGMGQP
ncbi:Protein indeterminate-domain 9 [Zea mays]|uniref:Protein indeterminate-domain 9 n=1 Tax=Zea mays TaxID=4577 RepID=A0A1D6NJZ4_MAIZE|nr:Protein indeterminate-domain 9 [Zea mays]